MSVACYKLHFPYNGLKLHSWATIICNVPYFDYHFHTAHLWRRPLLQAMDGCPWLVDDRLSFMSCRGISQRFWGAEQFEEVVFDERVCLRDIVQWVLSSLQQEQYLKWWRLRNDVLKMRNDNFRQSGRKITFLLNIMEYHSVLSIIKS